MARAGMLRAAARSRPGALGLLLMTTEISALGMRPAETLSARASKLEPRPLRRTPMRWVMNRKLNTGAGGGKIWGREERDLTQSSKRSTEGTEERKQTPHAKSACGAPEGNTHSHGEVPLVFGRGDGLGEGDEV